MFRIGIGHDTHRLVSGRPLILGGQRINFERGAEGHSDGDALCHAIGDAILGALCQGDFGVHFPDDDPRWKDANSLELLAKVSEVMRARGYKVLNADSTVLLEQPKLRDHIQAMRSALAEALKVSAANISVKAKTGEGLDAVGRGEAVTAHAIVLLTKEQG